ncbi:hypothetical protein OESDEN_16793 [Oesophagostomum dentatum]|uniref:Tetraspanin family protein n=1 Tax=Oesophagostomum dentatum TaxID=61180 RepID=A0A0B1SDW6_OESDE|nr:hypothetical protein OESDEN_16793 [Oesophagostomum dentatum]
MYDTIRNRYASDANYKAAFDTIQQEFECCGVKTYADWLGASWDRKSSTQTENAETRIEHGIGAVGGGRGNGYGKWHGNEKMVRKDFWASSIGFQKNEWPRRRSLSRVIKR